MDLISDFWQRLSPDPMSDHFYFDPHSINDYFQKLNAETVDFCGT